MELVVFGLVGLFVFESAVFWALDRYDI